MSGLPRMGAATSRFQVRIAVDFRFISAWPARSKAVRIERMGALDPTAIAWSMTTRSGALARAHARGHRFNGRWADRVSQVDSIQHPYSVTHCVRCGAPLFAEFARVEDETNPAIEADCAEAPTISR